MFNRYKNDTAEYDKQLEEDNQAMEKEIADFKKKLQAQTQKLDEYKKEALLSNNLIEKEKVYSGLIYKMLKNIRIK